MSEFCPIEQLLYKGIRHNYNNIVILNTFCRQCTVYWKIFKRQNLLFIVDTFYKCTLVYTSSMFMYLLNTQLLLVVLSYQCACIIGTASVYSYTTQTEKPVKPLIYNYLYIQIRYVCNLRILVYNRVDIVGEAIR